MAIEMIEDVTFNQGTQIKVIGIGGGGGNAVAHMIASAVQGVEFVCANTDAQALGRSAAHRTIQLGRVLALAVNRNAVVKLQNWRLTTSAPR